MSSESEYQDTDRFCRRWVLAWGIAAAVALVGSFFSFVSKIREVHPQGKLEVVESVPGEADLLSLERGDIFVTTEDGKEIPHVVLVNPVRDNEGWLTYIRSNGLRFRDYNPKRIVDVAPKLKLVARRGTPEHEYWSSRFLLEGLETQPTEK